MRAIQIADTDGPTRARHTQHACIYTIMLQCDAFIRLASRSEISADSVLILC